MSVARAVKAIEQHGMLLTYPVQNRPEPLSLWHVLHPKTPMAWAWDEDADPRVAAMWQLRESLARSRRVVYTKWLSGRATFFSRDLFVAMLAALRADYDLHAGLPREAEPILELLHESSPQSTRALREGAGLVGRYLESTFTRTMRALWERLLIVGFGEVEAGGFPALAVGATDVLYEDLWTEAEVCTDVHRARVARAEHASKPFGRAWRKVRTSLSAARERAGDEDGVSFATESDR